MLKKIKEILKDETGGPNVETIVGIGVALLVLQFIYMYIKEFYTLIKTFCNSAVSNFEV